MNKTLILATFAALSLGVGAATAQESAGGYIAGPYEAQQPAVTLKATTSHTSGPGVTAPRVTTLYGSSNRTPISDWPVLQGSDGNGS
jgi:hypothetical protein